MSYDENLPMEEQQLTASIGEITQLLRELEDGDPAAEELLFQRQYAKLRRVASQVVRACGAGLTLQTTDVLHEFYLRLKNQEGVKFNDTDHFLQIARKKMREVVWDYARKRKAAKRIPPAATVSVSDVLNDLRLNGLATADADPEKVLLLKQLLERLEHYNARDVDFVDLYYFLGLTHGEIAARYQMNEDTVKKRMQYIRAWLGARAKE